MKHPCVQNDMSVPCLYFFQVAWWPMTPKFVPLFWGLFPPPWISPWMRAGPTAFSVQSLSYVQLFAAPWTAAHQASLSITNSCSLLELMSIELVMPSNRLILCHPLLLLPSIFPSIRVFSSESVLLIRWPKYWSFSFSISPSNEYLALISFRVPQVPP